MADTVHKIVVRSWVDVNIVVQERRIRIHYYTTKSICISMNVGEDERLYDVAEEGTSGKLLFTQVPLAKERECGPSHRTDARQPARLAASARSNRRDDRSGSPGR